MVSIQRGDLFKSTAQVLVCPVNCLGEMGALAGLFQRHFPDECRVYITQAKAGKFLLGDGLLVARKDVPQGAPERFIYFFPTMQNPGEPSSEIIISMGLQTLEGFIRKRGLKSLAIPALGCGVGGLDFTQVFRTIKARFQCLPRVSVVVFAPHDP